MNFGRLSAQKSTNGGRGTPGMPRKGASWHIITDDVPMPHARLSAKNSLPTMIFDGIIPMIGSRIGKSYHPKSIASAKKERNALNGRT